MSGPDPKVLAEGAAAMLAAQADVPPAIIHTLRVLLNRAAYSPEHVKWIEEGVTAILERWEKTENLDELMTGLGLDMPKRRRKELTMRRETTIVAAIVDAALAGGTRPKRAAGDKLQADERELQRAWKKWKPVYLARLEVAASQADAVDAKRIRSAIDRLRPLK